MKATKMFNNLSSASSKFIYLRVSFRAILADSSSVFLKMLASVLSYIIQRLWVDIWHMIVVPSCSRLVSLPFAMARSGRDSEGGLRHVVEAKRTIKIL
jgi:hypothetical protein